MKKIFFFLCFVSCFLVASAQQIGAAKVPLINNANPNTNADLNDPTLKKDIARLLFNEADNQLWVFDASKPIGQKYIRLTDTTTIGDKALISYFQAKNLFVGGVDKYGSVKTDALGNRYIAIDNMTNADAFVTAPATDVNILTQVAGQTVKKISQEQFIAPAQEVTTVNTIAEMSALTNAKSQQIVFVKDSLRGGTFLLKYTASNTIDNITVYSSAIVGYVWERSNIGESENYLYVERAGISSSNSATTNTANLTAILTEIKNGTIKAKKLIFGYGVYNFNDFINIDGYQVELEGQNFTQSRMIFSAGGLVYTYNANPESYVYANKISNMSIVGTGTVDTLINARSQRDFRLTKCQVFGGNVGLNINYHYNSYVQDCYFSQFTGVGIKYMSSTSTSTSCYLINTHIEGSGDAIHLSDTYLSIERGVIQSNQYAIYEPAESKGGSVSSMFVHYEGQVKEVYYSARVFDNTTATSVRFDNCPLLIAGGVTTARRAIYADFTSVIVENCSISYDSIISRKATTIGSPWSLDNVELDVYSNPISPVSNYGLNRASQEIGQTIIVNNTDIGYYDNITITGSVNKVNLKRISVDFVSTNQVNVNKEYVITNRTLNTVGIYPNISDKINSGDSIQIQPNSTIKIKVVSQNDWALFNNDLWQQVGNNAVLRLNGTELMKAGVANEITTPFQFFAKRLITTDGINNNNVLVGLNTGSVVTGDWNTAIGSNALKSIRKSNENVAIGSEALFNLGKPVMAGNFLSGRVYTIETIGTTNFTAIGASSNTIGTTFVPTGVGTGTGTASANTNGVVAVGFKSQYNNLNIPSNTSVGYLSLFSNTTGSFSTAIGYQSGFGNTTGNYNFFGGYNAGLNNSTGSANTFVGHNAGLNNTTSVNNTSLGFQSLSSNTTGSRNTSLGSQSSEANTTGSDNVFLGFYANGLNGTISNSVAIGSGAIAGANNVFILGATGAKAVNVGINITTPQYKLDIDAQAGSSGNPLRLQGLNQGASTDSILTSLNGVVRRNSLSDLSVATVIKSANAVVDIPTITGMGTIGTVSVTVTGAIVGMQVSASPRTNVMTSGVSAPLVYVSATNTVTFSFSGLTVGTNGNISSNWDIVIQK